MNTISDMQRDSLFLNDLGGYTKRYDSIFVFSFSSICNEVTAAWSRFGISVTLESNFWQNKNKYYLNVQEISRAEAMRYACQQVGKSINDMNFTDY